MNLPATIPITDLEKCSPEYSEDKLTLYQALYDGGSAIEAVKKQLLPVRQIEKSAGGTSSAHYQERLDRAPYSRATAGFIDWLVAAVFKEPPKMEFLGELPEESKAFYEGLQNSADGRGTPLAQMMRDTVLECVLHRRSYPMVEFPDAEIDVSIPETMAGKFKLLKAREVEDFDYDTEGCARWFRWHGTEMVRNPDKPWEQPDRQRHVWIFIHAEGCNVYEAFKKGVRNGAMGTWEGKDAKEISSSEWDGLPVFEVKYRTGQWIMEACFDIAKALFIRDSSIEYLADKFAFQILVLNIDRQIDEKVLLPDLAAFHLRPGESVGFAAPQTQVLQPLFESAKKLRADLLNSIHASAQNAASIPQAGRLSGQAVNAMRDPLHIMLESFAWPVMDAWNRALAKMVEVRGDPEGCVRIVGLSEYDATEDELEEVINGKGERAEFDGSNAGEESGSDDESRHQDGGSASVQDGA
jgi:hypothetical protein